MVMGKSIEKFTIRNEDEFQRLVRLIDRIRSLEAKEDVIGGRRRYPIDVYMGDTRVSSFLHGNKTMYRINALTDSTGAACINEEVSDHIHLDKHRADKGDLSSTGKEDD